MGGDWFRGSDWDRATQQEFEQRLGRARSSRSQYLRIKGLGLAESKAPQVREAGRTLLKRVLTEHPDDGLQCAWSHRDLARSLAQDGYAEDAAEHYRLAMESGEEQLGLDYAELIVQAGWTDQFDQAVDLLIQSGESASPFPVNRFRWNLANARIAHAAGQRKAAAELADLALRAAAISESPFPRHPGVGLVTPDRKTLRELRRLANDRGSAAKP